MWAGEHLSDNPDDGLEVLEHRGPLGTLQRPRPPGSDPIGLARGLSSAFLTSTRELQVEPTPPCAKRCPVRTEERPLQGEQRGLHFGGFSNSWHQQVAPSEGDALGPTFSPFVWG